MKEKGKKEKILSGSDYKKALIKKALGYDATEIVEEYVSGEEGEIKLAKKKVTKKNVPPDITALKILLDGEIKSVGEMSDKELMEEKSRLLRLLEQKTIRSENEKDE